MEDTDPKEALGSLATLWDGVLTRAAAGGSEPAAGSTCAGTVAGTHVGLGALETVHAELAETITSEGRTVVEKKGADGGAVGTLRGLQVTSVLAEGGMGVVYRARQRVLQRDVALKTAHAHFAGTEVGEKFLSEALVTAHLEHPNVVPVYDLTVTDRDTWALAMKLVAGTPWSRLLHPRTEEERARAAAMSLADHLAVLESVGHAVAFAHSRRLVHLDVKPENVMVGEFGEVLVVDWGLAMSVGDPDDPFAVAPHVSCLATPCGTPGYMPPELAKGEGAKIGPWTDVFLLGATLHEVLTGRPLHEGAGVWEVISSAVDWDGPRFRDADLVPAGLGDLCRRALAPRPEDRYPTVAAFLADLRAWESHRESLAIAERARETHEGCRARATSEDVDRNRLYADFAEAVAGFRQALVLWSGNAAAREGEARARADFARAAIARGDLGLAEAEIASLPESDGDRGALVRAVGDARRARVRAVRAARWTRRLLVGSLALLAGGFGVGFWLVREERDRADRERALAVQRLAEIRRLADVKHAADLAAESDVLWPPVPANVPALQAWIGRAEELAARRSEHAATLAALAEGRPVDAGGRPVFDDPAVAWQADTLEGLVRDLDRFGADLLPSVRARLAFAESVLSKTTVDPREAWEETAARVRADPRFRGLELRPQLGLVPLGPDPETGLPEFAHLQSGELPARDAAGRLRPDGDTAIVLVLLPGGTFRMGAERPATPEALGSPHVDPDAAAHEGPVHEVALGPFFLSKFEMTQGQWLRLMGRNPSAYQPPAEQGGRRVTLANPVEQAGYGEAVEAMRRAALTLPTEARWEYAARAGTTTVYFTGDAKETLAGAVNLADRHAQTHGGPGSWKYETGLDDGHTVHAPVGSFRPNAFGLHDTAGNVWEWCLDRYAPYTTPVEPVTGRRLAPDDSPHVFRGGGFRANASHARSADRYSLYAPDYRAYDVGLRPARALDPP